MADVMDYIAHVDSKKRITLRGSVHEPHNVKEYANGRVDLKPREICIPDTISAKTLSGMDQAIANMKAGIVSRAIDLSDFD